MNLDRKKVTNVKITSHVHINVHPNPTIEMNRKFL